MCMLPDLASAVVQIDGMRMDLVKPRYETFDELYEYCYKVAGTVGLMTTPVMGVDPTYKVRPRSLTVKPTLMHSPPKGV